MSAADDLIALLAAQAPPGLIEVSLHASGDAALAAAIASAAASAVVTMQHPATPIDGALRALSPYCYRCPIGLTYPSCEIACLDSLATILRDHSGAAVVVEPAAEIAGGMITAPPGHLRRVRELCDAAGASLIADERTTGGGRSGFLWAVTRDGIAPDVLVAGRGIAPGIGATLSKEAIPGGSAGDAAVTDALSHLRRVTHGTFLGEARRKASNLTDALTTLAGHPRVGDVRVRGLLAGIELVEDKESKEPLDAAPFAARIPHATAAGNTLIIAPPLDIDDAAIDAIARAIVAALL